MCVIENLPLSVKSVKSSGHETLSISKTVLRFKRTTRVHRRTKFNPGNIPRPTSPEVIRMSYDHILSIQNLSEVKNPWRGLTMNRCLLLAVVIVVVSAGVNEIHEAVDSFVEETSLWIFGGNSVQDGSAAQPVRSLWETVVYWTWGEEDDEDTARLKKKQRLGGTMRLRNKEAVKAGLLKQE